MFFVCEQNIQFSEGKLIVRKNKIQFLFILLLSFMHRLLPEKRVDLFVSGRKKFAWKNILQKIRIEKKIKIDRLGLAPRRCVWRCWCDWRFIQYLQQPVTEICASSNVAIILSLSYHIILLKNLKLHRPTSYRGKSSYQQETVGTVLKLNIFSDVSF